MQECLTKVQQPKFLISEITAKQVSKSAVSKW